MTKSILLCQDGCAYQASKQNGGKSEIRPPPELLLRQILSIVPMSSLMNVVMARLVMEMVPVRHIAARVVVKMTGIVPNLRLVVPSRRI